MITGRLQIVVSYVCILQDLKSFALITFRSIPYVLKTGELRELCDEIVRFGRKPFRESEIEDNELPSIDVFSGATVQELTDFDAGAGARSTQYRKRWHYYTRGVKSAERSQRRRLAAQTCLREVVGVTG